MMRMECRLRVIFAERNIKQRDFANKIGVSQTSLSNIVRGKSLPSLPVAYKIAGALELSVEDIWLSSCKH